MIFKEHVAKLKEKWAGLSQREKRTLMIGAAALALMLLYLIVWSPFMERVAKLRKQVVVLQKNLVWMQEADKALAVGSQSVTPAQPGFQSPAALLSFLQQQLQEKGLKEAVSQLKQSSQDAVSLQFKEVSFDKLVAFLLNVAEKRNVSIRQVSVSSLPSPGMVNAQIVLVLSN